MARKPAKKSKGKGKAKSGKKGGAKKTLRHVKSKAGFTTADLRMFKEILVARRALLKGDVKGLEAEGLRTKDGQGELSTVPLHLADLGSDAYEQEMTLGLMESESDELQEIADALERLQDGSFGVCDNCDKSIPKMRLKVIPYTRLCIPCKQKEEGP